MSIPNISIIKYFAREKLQHFNFTSSHIQNKPWPDIILLWVTSLQGI